ncbi:DNA phosphorothioation system sulfurtransferase DndC [Brevibacillus dissolubilis]|uniref:DNA phosphorothioation system sulfurtransferase DndC n=1 Tax=Brevibacillus dissolubilis TaxID=1844116 RepID=UPI001C3F2877|nr:DNA phosphorothioation system sulfurtransferase DndC [Brevibacillus dissolubilis]
MTSTTMVGKEVIQQLNERIQELYLSDKIPWVVGYSGGKDSSTVLQLVWNAIKELSPEQRQHKKIYVISTDTLVEQPVVAAWVNRSLRLMNNAAVEQGLPIEAHRLTPLIENAFWVNLIGKGYPAPRNGFRWCTSRLKIDPSNRFITNLVRQNGEAIMVLGTRKAESVSRAANMNKYEQMRVRQWLSPNGSLPNSWVFTPIEDWTSDDVWMYLMQYKNPWGCSNKELMAMYREATADNECPLVVDTTTPSCGNSRFGCWVCTLVSEDKSMQAMIQNDEEKVWMMPLLEFRNEIGRLDEETGRIDDHQYRDYRRMDGGIKLYPSDNTPIHGPYKKERREYLLKRLLEVQKEIQDAAPSDIEELELITLEELRMIRKIWVQVKNEFDDSLPAIYEEVMNKPFPDERFTLSRFREEEWKILESLSGDNYVYMEMLSSLLNVEQRSNSLGLVRKGIVDELERHIKRGFYESKEDAAAYKVMQNKLRSVDHLTQADQLNEEDNLDEEDGTI